MSMGCWELELYMPLPPADFELEAFRQQLDEQGLAIADAQESSLKSRRRLADSVRDVKKRHPEVPKEVAAVMKLFQEEVDKLSARCAPHA